MVPCLPYSSHENSVYMFRTSVWTPPTRALATIRLRNGLRMCPERVNAPGAVAPRPRGVASRAAPGRDSRVPPRDERPCRYMHEIAQVGTGVTMHRVGRPRTRTLHTGAARRARTEGKGVRASWPRPGPV